MEIMPDHVHLML